MFIAAASSAYSFQNAEKATLIGLELDVRLRADRFTRILENVSVQGNFSWIDSEVSVKRDGIFQPTNLKRPLEGQAPYVLNLGLDYAGLDGLQAGLFFNRFGKRITAAGGSGLPDIYEQPRNALDATLSFPLRQGVRVKLKGTNLLDAEYRFQQTAGRNHTPAKGLFGRQDLLRWVFLGLLMVGQAGTTTLKKPISEDDRMKRMQTLATFGLLVAGPAFFAACGSDSTGPKIPDPPAAPSNLNLSGGRPDDYGLLDRAYGSHRIPGCPDYRRRG